MRLIRDCLITFLLLNSISLFGQEMTTYLSPFDAAQTLEKFKGVLDAKELNLFDVIDHQINAKKIGEELRPTYVVIFGNPEIGTQWMMCEQTVAIDLPLKVLIWEDETGDVFLSYTNPHLIGKRHQVKGCPEIGDKINAALVRIINETIRES
ncbi:MAG: DUF302 domain-containing protein [Cyclobacteriaceae bacterium]